MRLGLHWFRRRQHSLARGVLALFCAAWLQAAIAPCVMAHAAIAPATAPASVPHDHAAMAGHDHAAMEAMHGAGGEQAPCLYCPPTGAGQPSCDGHGCIFPHDPQVDARAASVLFSALPVSFVLPMPRTGRLTVRGSAAVPEAIPRVSIPVSYCRFIE